MALKDLYPALRAFLLGDSAISSAVGGQRIHVDELPQGQATTSIVLLEVSNVGDHHMQGASGLSRPRVQIAVWSQDRDTARVLSLAVKNRLDGYRGPMVSGASEVMVQGAFFDSSRWIKDETAGLFGRVQDYFITFEER